MAIARIQMRDGAILYETAKPSALAQLTDGAIARFNRVVRAILYETAKPNALAQLSGGGDRTRALADSWLTDKTNRGSRCRSVL